MVTAFSNDDLSTIKKFGKDFFFPAKNNTEIMYDEFSKSLDGVWDSGDTEKDKEEIVAKFYDVFLVKYIISTLYEDNGTLISDFNSVVPLFKQCLTIFKEPFSKVLLCFSLNDKEGVFNDEQVKSFYNLLHYTTPYLSSEYISDFTTFIINYHEKLNLDYSKEKCVFINHFIPNGPTYDSETAAEIYKELENSKGADSTKSIEETEEFLKEQKLPINPLEFSKFLEVKPYHYESNGILVYGLENYNVICYGVPCAVVEIASKSNGSVIKDYVME